MARKRTTAKVPEARGDGRTRIAFRLGDENFPRLQSAIRRFYKAASESHAGDRLRRKCQAQGSGPVGSLLRS